jgi:hypothetical protein
MQADVASVSGKLDYVEADLLGLTEEGAIRAGADPAAFATLRIPNDPERSGPRFEGTLTEFEAEYGGTEFDKKLRISTPGLPVHEAHALSVQLHNLVRKCGACGKSCAFTTTLCNGCGAELPQETVHTDNIFMSFIYGIAKVPCATLPPPDEPRVSCACACTAAQGDRFPYDIAVRLQTRELLVFDDPLALSPCHFCAIPTTCW